jgi:hypothetical protein
MVCAGNPAELCGANLRIQVYQDSTWFDPDARQLAAALQDYNETLAEFHQAALDYEADVKAWDSLTQPPSKIKRLSNWLRRRQDGIVLTPERRAALNNIKFNTGNMRAILQQTPCVIRSLCLPAGYSARTADWHNRTQEDYALALDQNLRK